MRLYIKNMVCSRCKMAVKDQLDKAGLHIISLELGEVEVEGEISKEMLQQLNESFNELGFDIIDDKKSRTIEKIKNLVVELVHHSDEEIPVNLSVYLSGKLHYDYSYLSNLFSEITNTTIEKFYISQKIEKVKELLKYDELSLSEIAFKLGYSSVAYLSNQFKKHTGLTPSFYKNQKHPLRRNIEEL